MALLQYLNTLPSRQRYTEESRNGCLLLKCCQEWTYLAPLGTADILLYSLENRILSLLHPSVYPQLSRQCTAISVITSVSPTANRGCETGKAFPRFISWKPTPFLTKHFYLWRVLGIRFTFLIFFPLCVWWWGCLLCNILQNSSSACNTCVCMERPTNAVKAWEKRCSREVHVQKNKQEPVITHLQKHWTKGSSCPEELC